MSWSTSAQVSITDEGLAELRDLPCPTCNEDNEGVRRAQEEQFDAARTAAHVALSGCGSAGDRAHVSLSGHANPGHGKRDGWSNEFISVSVRIV